MMRFPTLHAPMAPLYERENLPQRIRLSLNLMLYANLCGNMFGVVCGGTTSAMIGLANQLGAGDLAFGVINGLPQAAMLLQIPFSIAVNRTHHRKRYLLTYGLLSRFLWILFGMIPLIIPKAPQAVQLWSLIFLLGISSCCSASITPCWFPWYSDLTPVRMRSRWFSIRDMEVAVLNLLFGLLTAWLMQTLPPTSRYVVVFALGGTIGMIDMLCFAFCEEKYSMPKQKTQTRAALRSVFADKPFMIFTLMWTCQCFTANFAGAYHNRYCMNVIGLDFMQMMLFVTTAASLGTILIMPFWSRFSYRFGSRYVMLAGCIGTALCHLIYLFAAPGAVIVPLLANLLGSMFWSGRNLAANMMQLSLPSDENRSTAIALFSCLTALIGTALGTLLGGAILDGWENAGLFASGIDRYQMLTVIGSVLNILTTLLVVPKLKNDSDFSLHSRVRKV